MENSLFNLIEEAINTKNEELIVKISSKLETNLSQTKLMIKYCHKFIIISSVIDSLYCNYFGEIFLTELRENDNITDENFAKCIILFIKEKRKNKNLYYVNLKNENDIKLQILILSQLDYKSLEYDISYDEDKLDLKKHLNIFNYI